MNELVSGDLDEIELEMNTASYGPLRMIGAFAPILKTDGGGAIVNVLSAAPWVPSEHWGAYHAAKAAAWSLTNSGRLELSGQNALVAGMYMGPTGHRPGPGTVVPVRIERPRRRRQGRTRRGRGEPARNPGRPALRTGRSTVRPRPRHDLHTERDRYLTTSWRSPERDATNQRPPARRAREGLP
ncbi:SDR family NAD(P)-dependent oxidoreductase [Streptomyces scabiei]|nr:SDR family NAD(P)-dependent oxidoreductase [Streptomyces scabiei]MDX3448689.1 SDR family NAD(P)-dependent oxidoreductase [Streptomyces scabiei]MDX3474535.1 SDR family NAD(P)-dependent oxidoreductase [Streptomyces scabiei]